MIQTKNVIFDFDGTLVNTYPLWNYSYLLKFDRDNPKERNDCWKQYLSHLDECNVYDGIVNILEYLKDKQYNLYVVSGGSKTTINAAFKFFKLTKYFSNDKIISGYSINRYARTKKTNGNPALFNFFLKKYNLNPDSCIAFGNEFCDRLAANNANIEAYDCLWGATQDNQTLMKEHPFYLTSPFQIKELLN